jgi:hypothetical protein
MNFIKTCPNCKMRVLPKSDGTCPSCQTIISQDELVTLSKTPAAETDYIIHTPKIQVKKRILIAVTVLLVGLIMLRILFSLIDTEQVKAMSHQYLAEWSEMSEDEMLSNMDQRINAINPKPFGYNSDGLFNESFDDVFAVDDKGVTYVDAHDAIESFTLTFMVNRITLTSGRQSLQRLNRYGEATLRELGEDTTKIPQEADLDEIKSRLVNLAAELVSLRFKASSAQVLGLLDTLAGLAMIGLIVIVGFYALARRGAGGNHVG